MPLFYSRYSRPWMLPCLLLLLLLPASMPGPASGAEPAPPQRVLGRIDFPTTAVQPEAEAAFVRGVLWLHLFEYPFARREFQRAQELEPNFAMAYWGEAMTHNHPLWDEQDRDAALAALGRLAATPELRQGMTADPLEQAFLEAVDILYGAGTKPQRDRAHARALEAMAARCPENHEVQLFYALAVLGVQAGVRHVPAYMLATAIAQAVFSANPEHPGAAHYLIHGVDDPEHAVLGLQAARALARMAPDAAHAQHMASHIFTALGMWDDMVSANEAAAAVGNRMRAELGEAPRHWGHAHFWLLYGYLQQGRIEAARELLEAAYAEATEHARAPDDPLELDPDRSLTGSVVQMWTRYVLETRDWQGEIAGWKFNLGDAFDPNLNFAFVQGMRAAHAGQAAAVQQFLAQFEGLRGDLERRLRLRGELTPGERLYLDRLNVMAQQLTAAIDIARGEKRAAAAGAAEASRAEGAMPASFGPPFVDLPAAELHGELLLDARQYSEAVTAFELQLQRTPRRPTALFGLLRAQRRLEADREARYTAAQLAQIWSRADTEVRRLWEAATAGL